MPWGLTRSQQSGQSHFVTFCCYHRRRLLISDETRRIFESALERVRRSYRLYVYGYVVMPEHVHLSASRNRARWPRRWSRWSREHRGAWSGISPSSWGDCAASEPRAEIPSKSRDLSQKRAWVRHVSIFGRSAITISTFATTPNLWKSFVTFTAIR